MLQNSFLQHLFLLFHKEKKSQALRGKEPTKFRHLSKTQKHTAIFPLWKIVYFFSLSTFCRLFLLISSRSTACFVENDGLFYWKRRVVLLKTTCCFAENDVLFYWKRQLVFHKTTAYFFSSNGWILFQLWGMMKTMRKWIMKIPIISFSRACAYAHLQEFYHFCCHKCHSILVNHYNSTHCPYPRT